MRIDQTEEQRRRLLSDEGVKMLISRRAYDIYLERGGEHGKDWEDWILAEEQVLSLLQELIQREIKLQGSKQPEAKSLAVPGEPKRPSKKTPLTSEPKKRTVVAPKPNSKVIPKETRP